jgi:hypothetical protein
MKRSLSRSLSAMAVCAALLAPVLRADVKTTEKSTFKLEGMMGAMINRMAGGADGTTSTVAVKGNRMSRLNDTTGQIVDLTEEKIYTLDVKRKEYTVMTFAEMRKKLEEAKAQLAKQQQQMKPEDKQAMEDLGKQFEFDVEARETGQTRTIAGQDVHEVVLTLTMRQAGKKLEEGGGMVMTNTMWLAPRVPALDEVAEFNMKFAKALFGGTFMGIDPQQVNALTTIIPGIGSLMERMAAEGRKLKGTPLSTASVLESVKSSEQVQGAQQQSGGGGLGGMLARRLGGGSTTPRTKALTTTHDVLSIAPSAAAEDVAIPAGFKEKK